RSGTCQLLRRCLGPGRKGMSVERKAFTRAWRFLGYKPVAKWSALAASVVTAICYVALLLVLSLFADLLVNRGQIPNYRALSPKDREAFLNAWNRPVTDAADEEMRQFYLNERKERLAKLGISDQAATALARADVAKLSP